MNLLKYEKFYIVSTGTLEELRFYMTFLSDTIS